MIEVSNIDYNAVDTGTTELVNSKQIIGISQDTRHL